MVIRPTRTTFPSDATPEESALIGAHFQYLRAAFEAGTVKFVGRCEDAAFGLVVFRAESRSAAVEFAAQDPAVLAGIFDPEVREFLIVLS